MHGHFIGLLDGLSSRSRMTSNGCILIMTCSACPEQYDVYFKNQLIGYLRLRHGHFTAQYPDSGGKLVYSVVVDGDGYFEEYEREEYLNVATIALLHTHERNSDDN